MPTRCFVAMPIGADGSADHAHFKALYDEIIKPTLEGLGFVVIRSDDVQRSGAITKDIIRQLADADLVIVDLTTLNPNVFYELGVRHSLRGQGTVMIVDDLRSDSIPFDLSAYRVIKFRGDLPGLGKLRRELLAFAQQLHTDERSHRDNPVHDCLPALPLNAVEAATGSTEGMLREQLARIERQLTEYKIRYGDSTAQSADVESPLAAVMAALDDAAGGNLPSDLLAEAEKATEARDTRALLTVIRRVLERPTLRLLPRQYTELADLALRLGLREVTDAILVHARRIHPKSSGLRTRHLVSLAHSEDLTVRARARREILNELAITIGDDQVTLPAKFSEDKDFLFGILMDTYSDCEPAEAAEALRLTQASIEKFPHRTRHVRNRARALEWAERTEEALEWYQRAVWCPDVDDTSAVWFGSELHNRRRHVDAIEAYCLACILDPDDAKGFALLADEIAWALKPGRRPATAGAGPEHLRDLPEGIDVSTMYEAAEAALSCQINEENVQRLTRAFKRLQAKPIEITPQSIPLDQRADLACKLYEQFKSHLTIAPDMHDATHGGEG